ncbi:MAG: EamA family transporter RarD [Acidimicrobiales bacterium]
MNRGVALGATAYVLWGISPIYWRSVDSVAAGDIVIHRVLTSLVFLVAAQFANHTFGRLRTLVADRRARMMFVLTATLLAANWLVFVWAVNDDRVLEASLGYFINPLVSVVLGVVVLNERLRTGSLVAVAIAAVGVVVLAIDVGTVPWVSLFLAGTFALYGLVRKTSPAGSLDGLTLEMFVLVPFALVALLVHVGSGDSVFTTSSPGLNLWLVGAGVVTAAPLLLFATAARQIELWLVGMLQFIAPTIQFVLGAVVWHEPWSGGQAVGFVVIWAALGVFVVDQLRVARGATRRLAIS